ncbi:hypothetical protein NCCP2222_14630 [Sporosarcina sp. NCCP-2222]|nr:hypothetical protein NCCP2222_14630 [Sporosarcina sp. NCCP-2222]
MKETKYIFRVLSFSMEINSGTTRRFFTSGILLHIRNINARLQNEYIYTDDPTIFTSEGAASRCVPLFPPWRFL